MKYILLFYPIAMNVFGSTLQAFGYPTVQTTINLVGIFGFRTLWMQFIYGNILPETVENIYLCFPISIVLVHSVTAALVTFVLLRYRTGKYKENL